MLKNFLKFSLIIFLLNSSVRAQPFPEELRDLLIGSNVEAAISLVELEKDFNWNKRKIKLNENNSVYYAIALLVKGDLEKADLFIKKALEYHPKNEELQDANKHIFLAEENYSKDIKFSKTEKAHIKVNELLKEFKLELNKFRLEKKVIEQDFFSDAELPKKLVKLRKKLEKETSKLEKNIPYFKTKLEYLIALRNPELNSSLEKQALAVIKSKQKKLFPKTMDFYESSGAYRTLSLLSLATNNHGKAQQYLELSKLYLKKMRAIWLEEDLIIDKPIMKMTERKTKFGYVIPQWLVVLNQG